MNFDRGHRRIDVTLRVPAESDVEIHTGDGAIDAHGLSGSLRFSTGDGKITLDALSGDLKLHAGDGNIAGAGLAGRLSADTGDGDVDVRGRFRGLDVRRLRRAAARVRANSAAPFWISRISPALRWAFEKNPSGH